MISTITISPAISYGILWLNDFCNLFTYLYVLVLQQTWAGSVSDKYQSTEKYQTASV